MPGEACWPSEATWRAFNASVDGRLIRSVPVAATCYDWPLKDEVRCAQMAKMWTDERFQTGQPLGR